MFTVITPSTHDIGAFDVRRTLPNKARTMVGPETTSALIVVYAPAESPLALREHALRLTEERIRVHLGGEVTWTHVAGGGQTGGS